MNRYLVIFCLLCVAALGLGGWEYKRQLDRNGILKAKNTELAADLDLVLKLHTRSQAALAHRERALKRVQAEKNKAEQALESALQANKNWSDTDVPDEVKKALGGADSPADGGLREQGYDTDPTSGATQGLPGSGLTPRDQWRSSQDD